ncbi:hypothetical protein S40285_09618 [Stachybotrys chlorohalonatus IBT 40285]|uniref:Major facilitator superfamily (MFS) profile domain-containing protein n=1 Tax=Stachybotrys chlorohalonatus (strain IBT 40285) TaxID=1283841 RepID=A0A084QC45_STAC4|nr:hypothetical protein S40285_09618 [Stachybotrys chlorohalonata IBT 40285]
MYMVFTRWLRSRWSILILTTICAAFSGAYMSVRSEAENLAFPSMINLWLNGMYAVVYSYTPLAVDAESRGVATGAPMALGRMASLGAPFIATFSDVITSAPLWVAYAAFIDIGLAALASPIDTIAYKEEKK